MNIKKVQFWFITTAFIATIVLFLISFITVFLSYFCVGEYWYELDTDVLSVFTILFLAVGNIIAPIVRDCYDEAYGELS